MLLSTMFGQKPGGFGAGFGAGGAGFGSSTPFGQSSSGFGNQVFGSNTQTPTAGTGLFGQNAAPSGTSTGLFVKLPTSFGTFGSTPSSTSSLFGGQQGQMQQQQTQQNPGSGLFSGATPQNAFGAKPSTFGGFGGGTQTTGTGLFGGVSQSATPSLFGQTAATPGVFGATAGAAVNGTTVKFNPPTGTDTMIKNGVTTNISIRHQCITAMKEYENKSLEELRFEDYAAGRKGKQGGGLFGATPTSQAPTGFGGFNQSSGFGTSTGFGGGTATSSSGGLFGGQQAGGQFGQFKPLFGGTSQPSTTSGFNFSTPTPAGNSLFGQPQNKTPFGTTTTTQSGLFGNTSTFGTASTGFGSSPFGTQNQSGGLFGNKPAGFGTATTTASGFSFGGAGGTSNLFAKPATSSSSQFSGFGTGTSTTGFGATTGGGLFGNKPTGFGHPAPSLTTGTGGFNFGGANMSTGTGGGLFGNTQNKSFGTFNFGTSSSGTGLGGLGTTNTLSVGNASTLGGTTSTANSAQLQQQLQYLSPFGDSTLFWSVRTSSKKEEAAKPSSLAVQKAHLSNTPQYKISPLPAPKIRPKSLHSYINGGTTPQFDGMEDDDFGFGLTDTFTPRKSVKKLVLKRGPGNSGISSSRASSAQPHSPRDSSSGGLQETAGSGGERFSPAFPSSTSTPRPQSASPDSSSIQSSTKTGTAPRGGLAREVGSGETPGAQGDRRLDSGLGSRDSSAVESSGSRFHLDEQETDLSLEVGTLAEEEEEEDAPRHPAGVVLTRPGYYTVPSLEELAALVDEEGNCRVENFTIGREKYGSLFFPGVTDVANLNLDEIVHFRRKEVVVYPDDDKKPPRGQGLNKPAEITLDCVWPNSKATKLPIKDVERLKALNYQKKLEDTTAKFGGKFVDYRPETGSWVFLVKHFSSYGVES